ncbi:FeoA family protein [Levilactobacillus namurensis]|uniref:FeoA family protein n=2 Tax=Levilactobacillus namurensis TaxID=380393 RepID=UPI0036F34010
MVRNSHHRKVLMTMQLLSQQTASPHFEVRSLSGLDDLMVRRLHRLGIRSGSRLTVVRQYPFHGPIIIQVDQQRIALRYAIFQALIGGH